uniref:Uncharacterized protein n=1 Tax=Anguilla anguilla TaxID=7936 RepID=A0A0E9Q7G0_ANGAN
MNHSIYIALFQCSKCFTVMRGNSPHPPSICTTHLGDARQPFCTRILTVKVWYWFPYAWYAGRYQVYGN